MIILSLESSTTSAKAMLYDTETKNYKIKTLAYSKDYVTDTTHDADSIFEKTMEVGKALCENVSVNIISLSGTWHSMLLCDGDMVPQTPVYLWSYTGASELCKTRRKNSDYVSRFYRKTGCMVNGIYPAFKLIHLKNIGYQLKNYLIADQGSYNMYRLTDERVTTDSMASGTGLFNIHTKTYDQDILSEIGLSEKQLCKIITYKETYPLSRKGAKHLGLNEGIPVMATNPDGGLNQLGAGAIEEGVMTFSVGTSGALRLATQNPRIPDTPSTWCYLSPKGWLSGAATSGSCNCIDWVKNNFFTANSSYEEIERDIANPLDTPVFLPFIFGERCPGWHDDRVGSFQGCKPYHNASDMYLSVMEGVLFNLYQCYEILVGINGTPRKIKLSGGILNSKLWTQMCVDIFGMDMEIDQVEHSSLLGGIALGMEQLKIIDDASKFKNEESMIIRTNPEMAEIYKKKYENYKYWYERVL